MNPPCWILALAALLPCPDSEAAATMSDIGASIDISSKRLNPPVYPPDAARACIGGTVIVIVDVDKQGRHVGAIVEKSSRDPRLDQAALEASRTWSYNPGMINGEPVADRVRLPIDFEMADDCQTAAVPGDDASVAQFSVEDSPLI